MHSQQCRDIARNTFDLTAGVYKAKRYRMRKLTALVVLLCIVPVVGLAQPGGAPDAYGNYVTDPNAGRPCPPEKQLNCVDGTCRCTGKDTILLGLGLASDTGTHSDPYCQGKNEWEKCKGGAGVHNNTGRCNRITQQCEPVLCDKEKEPDCDDEKLDCRRHGKDACRREYARCSDGKCVVKYMILTEYPWMMDWVDECRIEASEYGDEWIEKTGGLQPCPPPSSPPGEEPPPSNVSEPNGGEEPADANDGALGRSRRLWDSPYGFGPEGPQDPLKGKRP